MTIIGIALVRNRNTIEARLDKDAPFFPIKAFKRLPFWLVAFSLLFGFFGTVIPAAYFVSVMSSSRLPWLTTGAGTIHPRTRPESEQGFELVVSGPRLNSVYYVHSLTII